MRILKRILIFVIICAAAGFILSHFKDRIIKYSVESYLTRSLGAKVEMDKFQMDLIRGSMHITSFKLFNPEGFSPALLLYLPKIEIEFDLTLVPLSNPRLLLRHVDINLEKLLFEKNKEGKSNVDSINITFDPKKPLPVDLLNLRIGQVVEKDYRYDKPLVRSYNLNLKKSYVNIRNMDQLTFLLMVEPLKQAGIKGAEIFGFAALVGNPVALPVAVALSSMGKGKIQQEIEEPAYPLFDLSLKVLDELGDIKKQDKKSCLIVADIHGAEVVVRLEPKSENKTVIHVSAKKFFLSQHGIASGALYEILEELGKQQSANR
jgi:hypothetical protein